MLCVVLRNYYVVYCCLFVLGTVTMGKAQSFEYPLLGNEEDIKIQIFNTLVTLKEWRDSMRESYNTSVLDVDGWLKLLDQFVGSLPVFEEGIADSYGEVEATLSQLDVMLKKIEEFLPDEIVDDDDALIAEENDDVPIWWDAKPPPIDFSQRAVGLTVKQKEPESDPERLTFNPEVPILFDHVVLDTHFSYDASTGIYSVSQEGLYTVLIQMGSSDLQASSFELRNQRTDWRGWVDTTVIATLDSGLDPGFVTTSVWLITNDKVALYPIDSMDGITSNVKGQLISGLSIFTMHIQLPPSFAG